MFTITDGVYGTVFYAGPGLHFFHMLLLDRKSTRLNSSYFVEPRIPFFS